MIVVDTNVLVYLLLPGEHTAQAERVLLRDPVWAAPLLWRSEFRNVLAVYMRQGRLLLDQALQLMDNAEILLQGREYTVSSVRILSLVAGTRCSAYDGVLIGIPPPVINPHRPPSPGDQSAQAVEDRAGQSAPGDARDPSKYGLPPWRREALAVGPSTRPGS